MIGGFRLSWLRRRWWIIVATTVAVTLVALLVNRPAPTTYTAESVLLVRSGATENTPGSANEAGRLAVTYSQLIPTDAQVLDAVSTALNLPRPVVAAAISASNDANTSILRVRYTASDARTAIAGARAIPSALVGATPAAANFRGVALSTLPDTATKNSTGGTSLPVGILLGALLGIVLVIGLERSNGRLDSVDDIVDEVDCPVTALQGLSAGSILALVHRWTTLARPAEVPASALNVAIVTVAPGQRALSQEVAVVFATTANADEVETPTSERISLFASGAPSTWEVGETVVQGADLVVLVLGEGTSIGQLRKSVEALRDFGATPSWLLYASDTVVRRARRHHGIGEASVSVIEPRPAAITS